MLKLRELGSGVKYFLWMNPTFKSYSDESLNFSRILSKGCFNFSLSFSLLEPPSCGAAEVMLDRLFCADLMAG